MAARRIAQWGCPTIVGLVILTCGCPQLPPEYSMQFESGTYWIESRAGGLDVYSLPLARGQAVDWRHVEVSIPPWYSEAGLYTLDEFGAWTREANQSTRTLDDFLQTYDPAPPVGG